jgi:hypothetical protein
MDHKEYGRRFKSVSQNVQEEQNNNAKIRKNIVNYAIFSVGTVHCHPLQ